MSKKFDRIIWGDSSWFPGFYGFCPNKKAWRRNEKIIGDKHADPYPTAAGRCTNYTKDERNVSVVTVNLKRGDLRGSQVVGLLAHEATHVWQFMRDDMGEAHPSIEFEAYAIQAITQNLIAAFERTRWRITK